ncbi:MAG: hypothetical protein AAF740_11560, partial [Bacteroidota bacterium]
PYAIPSQQSIDAMLVDPMRNSDHYMDIHFGVRASVTGGGNINGQANFPSTPNKPYTFYIVTQNSNENPVRHIPGDNFITGIGVHEIGHTPLAQA